MPQGLDAHAHQIISAVNNIGAPDVTTEGEDLPTDVTEDVVPRLEIRPCGGCWEAGHNRMTFL